MFSAIHKIPNRQKNCKIVELLMSDGSQQLLEASDSSPVVILDSIA